MPTSKGVPRFNAKEYVKDGATEQDVIALKECFDIFDTDKSGKLDLEELRNAIVALGLEQNAQKIMNLLSDIDSNHDNEIEFEEFLILLGFY